MNYQKIGLECEQVYHIYNRANGSERLFLKDSHYFEFLEKYRLYIAPIADTHAYCLLPNHFHLLVRIKSQEEVEKFFASAYPLSESPGLSESGFKLVKQFGNLFSSYTQWLNKKTERKGSLFTPKFKRKLVGDSEYFTQLVAYIHTNPIKHGLTDNLYEWAYSSFHAYTTYNNSQITTDIILDFFGGKNALIDFHSNFSERLVEKMGLDLE